jgi:molecular chaperone GrpE
MRKREHEYEINGDAEVAAGDPSATGESSGAATGNPLEEQLKALQAEKQELANTLVRRQADFENYRKRTEREKEQERHRGVEALIEALLPVLDGFDRALAAHGDAAYEEHRKGFELIDRQFHDILAKRGLVKIEAIGKEFDPNMHHAVDRVESADHADGVVLGVLQEGYLFHGRVLRPAMVRVAVHPAPVN